MNRLLKQTLVIAASLMLIIAVVFVPGCSKPAPTTPAPTTPTQPSTQEPAKPDIGTISISTWPLGSTVHTIASGFALAMQEKGAKTRLIPIGTSVARLLTAKYGEADLCGLGSSDYVWASQGIGDYSGGEWEGPQKLRLALQGPMATICFMVKGDSGINSFADLKGKKIITVPGSPHIDGMNEARLATAGLTWDDVTKVVAPDQIEGGRMVMEGKADGCHMSTSEPHAVEFAAMPGSIKWLDVDPSDKEAWAIIRKIAPYVSPTYGKKGPNLPEEGIDGMGSPYGFISYDFLDYDKAYFIMDAVWDGYDVYKEIHPRAAQFTHEVLKQPCGLPYHEALVQFYKDKGEWTDDMQEFQDEALRMEEERFKAFEAAKIEGEKNETPFGSAKWGPFWEEFLKNWMKDV